MELFSMTGNYMKDFFYKTIIGERKEKFLLLLAVEVFCLEVILLVSLIVFFDCTDVTGRITSYDSMWRNGFRHYATSSNDCSFAYSDTWHDLGIGTDNNLFVILFFK